jgi:3-deoxy-7-phosphoheptulonate synthase
VAVKVSGAIHPEELLEILVKLNPDDKPGKVTLIHRMGRARIESQLPELIEAVAKSGRPVLWVCDPMHGNTVSTSGGRKTRRFDDIVDELKLSFAIHRACGSALGGAHLELTGENVTECVGGSRGITESDLESAYQTQLDPRLNYEQALEIAFEISNQLSQQRF